MRVISTSEFQAAVRDSGGSFNVVTDGPSILDNVAERPKRRRRRPRATKRAGLADAFAAYTRRR